MTKIKSKHPKVHLKITGLVGLFVAATVVGLLSSHSFAAAPTITEYATPSNTSTWGGITKGPDGNVWYVENPSNMIAKVTPAGVSTDYAITTASADARYIAAGADGNLWFTEYAANKIGKITPTGTITEYAVTTASAGAFGITAGPDGNIWFTEVTANKIAKITPTGTITEFATTVQPFSITTGPDGNLWVAAANDNKVSKITTSGVETDYTVPTATSANAYVAAGPDGNVWFTERNGNKIGKITPTGTITEYPIPTAAASVQAITLGPDGNMWFAEFNANKIGYVTTAGVFTELAVPTASSNPGVITAGADGNMWFTELAILANKVGKVTLPLAPGIANSSVTATSGAAKTVNLVSGVSNNPSAATLAIVSGPLHGTASVDTSTGVLTYTSAAGYVGTDPITYKLCSADDLGQCATAVLSISVSLTATAGGTTAPNTGYGAPSSSNHITMLIGIGSIAVLAAGAIAYKKSKAKTSGKK